MYRFYNDLPYYQIGTDIQDFKCSWLVVKALEHCNDEQKKLLHVSLKNLSSLDYVLCNFLAQTLQKYCPVCVKSSKAIHFEVSDTSMGKFLEGPSNIAQQTN